MATVLLFSSTIGCSSHGISSSGPTITSAPAPAGVTSTPNAACSVDTTATTTTSGTAAPAITPASTSLTVYPGQTVTLPVAIAASGTTGAPAPVIVGVSSLPAGLTVQQVASETGQTATLTLVSANTIANSCFNGSVIGLDSVAVPLVLEANSNTGQTQIPITLNVSLENPAFAPVTTDLPVLSINTQGGTPVPDSKDYVTTAVSIADTADTTQNYAGTGEIKLHGNSTAGMPKKPYKIKLDSKAPLLGMKKAKNWILLANYDDKSMLRTSLAFEVSKMTGLLWTPSTQFVEVNLNGAYLGTYQLSEDVEIDSNRLNIHEVSDTDNSGDAITGGYLMQIDYHYGEDFVTTTPRGLPIGTEDPDPPTSEQEAYLTNMLATAENALYSATYEDVSTGWRAYFDEQSFVDWYLTEELLENNDAAFYSSDYLYKLIDDTHLYMGPVWDFDIAAGNVNYSKAADPTVPWVRQNAFWYEQLFKDPSFLAAVQARWTAIRPQVGTLSSFIDSQAALLARAQANNYARWPTLGEMVWPNTEAAGSYQGEVNYLKSWLAQRIATMDALYLTQ